MSNLAINDSINFSDVMKTNDTAKLLHCSGETIRQLTERNWHPLPFVNTGIGMKRQRLFMRSSVLRWMREEEQLGAAASEPAVRARAATASLSIPAPQPATPAPPRRGRPRKQVA